MPISSKVEAAHQQDVFGAGLRSEIERRHAGEHGGDAAAMGDDVRVKLSESDEARCREADARVAAEAELARLRSEAGELSDRLEVERAAHVAARREAGRLEALLAQRPLSDVGDVSDDSHVVFLPSATGYLLMEQAGPAPDPGSYEEVEDMSFRVNRIGRSPLPADTRRCAYLEVP